MLFGLIDVLLRFVENFLTECRTSDPPSLWRAVKANYIRSESLHQNMSVLLEAISANLLRTLGNGRTLGSEYTAMHFDFSFTKNACRMTDQCWQSASCLGKHM